mmetsp:Transcript_39521/g.91264  ORF Transcript_39521/g.91264 Transcript_39521/m.91264 type:complete len:134 (+) Transcript_39521:54-455(+)
MAQSAASTATSFQSSSALVLNSQSTGSKFLDNAWTKRRSTTDVGPVSIPKVKYPYHISGYKGHKPLNWMPFDLSTTQDSAAGSMRSTQEKWLPRAARTASDGYGAWYGYVGAWPNAVDGWHPNNRALSEVQGS